ncbi:unnamed protein product [Caenorhabditis auriculariae]|uniref:Receptor expression-enhancing protein n=1 Tax=Caenorhabditis auriculariae TaxID=2777116 RepID=A0A8S1HLK5_9PELO|nr:unnamed protein product [Caenorhabditis auriculariae]
MSQLKKEAAAVKSPIEGVTAAKTDFVSFLYASHGKTYDEYVAKAEETTGLKRENLSYVLYGLLAFYLIFGSAAKLLCNLIGFGYPAYASVKAIRSVDKKDDTQWLTYWTVFATISLFDFFSQDIYRFFPFIYVFKAVFLVYLYLPQTHGTAVFYTKIVDPLVTRIDNFFGTGAKQ